MAFFGNFKRKKQMDGKKAKRSAQDSTKLYQMEK